MVAYRLALPETAKIHNVFHVSLLKPFKGELGTEIAMLPPDMMAEQPAVGPEAVIGRRTIFKKGQPVEELLVRWEGGEDSDATWEDRRRFQEEFPMIDLEDKKKLKTQSKSLPISVLSILIVSGVCIHSKRYVGIVLTIWSLYPLEAIRWYRLNNLVLPLRDDDATRSQFRSSFGRNHGEATDGDVSGVCRDPERIHGGGENAPGYRRFKMDPPVTDGSDPHTWLFKATEFFEFNAIPKEERLKVTGLMLDGAAVEWFRRMKRNELVNTWADFEEQFKFRFDPEMYEDYFGLLSKLQQTTTTMAYQTEFERLLNKVEGVPETTLISVYISGLKDPVRRELRVNRPSTLNGAFALTRETAAKYEELQQPARKNWTPTYNKSTNQSNPDPTKPLGPYIPPSKEPLLATPRPAKPLRRISPAEKAEKDARGECYFCPEKWSRGHHCNGRYYLLVTNENEEGGAEYDDEPETIFKGDVSVLQSLAGSPTPISIRLKGEIHGQTVDVLVDGGSTHNFIHPKTAE
ncbi:unnamed protein product [Cuscuta campestris]|uniref:Uncharacterized protein n=1 Tax=Cuscuta campestris TaxID=132261 RepID=A0A484NH43_9ASTE|nr:unnamed protein product [Cuscuta campestris]